MTCLIAIVDPAARCRLPNPDLADLCLDVLNTIVTGLCHYQYAV